MNKVCILLLFIVALVGCSSSNKFIGKWYIVEEDDTIVTYTFNNDGSCSIERESESQKCKYEYDDKKIKIESDFANIELNYYFIEDFVEIGNVKLYKELEHAKENKDSFVVINKQITVPDVSNLDLSDAITVLKDNKFTIGDIIKEYNSDIEKNKVIKTIPAAGVKRDIGTEITIYESNGRKCVKIEDYIGKNYLEIKTYLESYGIYVEIDKEDSNLPSGTIVNQSIGSGATLYENAVIILSVAR